MPELSGRSLRVVDIAADDALVAELGELIPVLEIRDDDGGRRRLNWPFDSAAVADALG
jgi:hypothetical protein